jgi:hypothetical protein
VTLSNRFEVRLTLALQESKIAAAISLSSFV